MSELKSSLNQVGLSPLGWPQCGLNWTKRAAVKIGSKFPGQRIGFYSMASAGRERERGAGGW